MPDNGFNIYDLVSKLLNSVFGIKYSKAIYQLTVIRSGEIIFITYLNHISTNMILGETITFHFQSNFAR